MIKERFKHRRGPKDNEGRKRNRKGRNNDEVLPAPPVE
jgi:hypothetical protein